MCQRRAKNSLWLRRRLSTSALTIPSTTSTGRIDFGDSWGLVRASNTQPILVLRFEAPSEERLEAIQSLVERELVALEKTL